MLCLPLQFILNINGVGCWVEQCCRGGGRYVTGIYLHPKVLNFAVVLPPCTVSRLFVKSQKVTSCTTFNKALPCRVGTAC
jgi:hypothetical protein